MNKTCSMPSQNKECNNFIHWIGISPLHKFIHCLYNRALLDKVIHSSYTTRPSSQGLEGGGGGGSDLHSCSILRESRIPLSSHIDIPHPLPNFGESHFPGAVKPRIPYLFLVKSQIPRIPFQTLSTLVQL